MSFDSSRVYIAGGDCGTTGNGITCNGAVTVYQRGSSKHLRTISAPSRSYFEGSAVDDSGNVYVETFAFGSGKVRILVYPPRRNKAEVFIRGYGLGDPVLYPKS
jgi:hypothetical protein